eukprot:jgi/Phyca11/130367/e_gw1.93.150.1
METEQYSASYWCTHGRVRATESSGLRTHSKQRSTNCQVRISATLVCTGMDQYKIRVSSKGISHNHRVDPDVYKIYPQNRAVNDPRVLGTIDAMRKGGAKARGVLMYLRDATEGKEMTTLKDIHNLMARLKAESKQGASDDDCAEAVLRDLCRSDKGAVASLHVDATHVLQSASFQTRKMRRLFSAFPEVLLVDTTFGTNANRYKLFSFVVHDIHGKVQHSIVNTSK